MPLSPEVMQFFDISVTDKTSLKKITKVNNSCNSLFYLFYDKFVYNDICKCVNLEIISTADTNLNNNDNSFNHDTGESSNISTGIYIDE